MFIRHLDQGILAIQTPTASIPLEAMEVLEDLVGQDLEGIVVVTVDTIHMEVMEGRVLDRTPRTGKHHTNSLVATVQISISYHP